MAALASLAASASAAPPSDGRGMLPSDGRVVAEARRGRVKHLYLELPQAFLRHDATERAGGPRLTERWLQRYTRTRLARARARDPSVRGVLPWVVDPARPGRGWVPLRELLPPIAPPPSRPGERALSGDAPLPRVARAVSAPRDVGGFLDGKVVHVSAGHGFFWKPSEGSDSPGRWATQRPVTHQLLEDLLTAEAVDHYLVPYLRNAGATVFTSRERDVRGRMAVVDAEPGGQTAPASRGSYEELSGSWQDSPHAGFRPRSEAWTGAANPFEAGGDRVTPATGGEPTARARWVPDVPRSGRYTVYVSYSRDASRVPDAHYVVRHRGGTTHVRVDQRRHGGTWVALGRFRFAAGRHPTSGSVTLLDDSELAPQGRISADAVRLGGGRSRIRRGPPGGTVPETGVSRRPRWEEAAPYHAQYAGAPPAVWDASGSDRDDDVSTRPRYAAWQNESGEDAVYVAWHTNAPAPARGTSTFIYGPNPPGAAYEAAGVEGSELLGEILHDTVLGHIRAGFDPDWTNRGLGTAWFGELNPDHNPEMPAALVEVGFHATEADAEWLAEPRFRKEVARAYYEAIARYFAARDGLEAAILPRPPRRVRATVLGPSRVRVGWAPPTNDDGPLGTDPATGYRVYPGHAGRAFGEAVEVADGATSVVLEDLPPGEPLFVRVTATNAGGESMPSPVVAARPPCEGEATSALLVHGFYRLDAFSLPVEDLAPWAGPAWDGSLVKRLRPERVNDAAHLVEHARAFAAAGVAFDGAEAPAVAADAVSLSGYDLVDWQLGEESTVDETFDPAEQDRVASWLATGGRTLLVSGAELAWDLDEQGSAEDRAFLHDRLGVAYAADDAGTYEAAAAPGADLAPALDLLRFGDGQHGSYDVDFPDVLEPLEGSTPLLRYPNGAGPAGIRHALPSGSTAFVLGFPLETIRAAPDRTALAAHVAAASGVSGTPSSCPAAGAEPAAETAGDAATSDAGAPRAEPADADPALGPAEEGDAAHAEPAVGDPSASEPSEPTGSGGGCRSSAGAVRPTALAAVMLALLGVGRRVRRRTCGRPRRRSRPALRRLRGLRAGPARRGQRPGGRRPGRAPAGGRARARA